MEASEAMVAMHAAGRGAEADEIVTKAIQSARGTYEAIESDESRTDDYKQAELAQAYETARESVATTLAGLANEVRRSSNSDAARAFGIEGLSGDTASLTISRRDAVDRVAQIQSKSERLQMLEDATRSGDEVLARAIAQKAMENRDADTLHAFVADRPQLDAIIERIWKSQSSNGFGQGGPNKMRHTMALHDLRPAGLKR